MGRSDLKLAFLNIQDILDAHYAFLKALDEVMAHKDGRMISKLFMTYVGSLCQQYSLVPTGLVVDANFSLLWTLLLRVVGSNDKD